MSYKKHKYKLQGTGMLSPNPDSKDYSCQCDLNKENKPFFT